MTALLSLNVAISKLDQQLDSKQVQITIIDNAEQESVLQEIIAKAKNELVQYTLITGLGNIGYGRANNIAIKKTKTKYHLILNPDVILDENSLLEGLSYLNEAELKSSNIKINAVSPRAVDDNGQMQYLCKRFPSVLVLLLRGFAPQKIKNLFKEKLYEYENRDRIQESTKVVVKNVPFISGCFMLCNTAALQKVGGFDEGFFLHFEDLALSLALRKEGELCYLPSMKIQHFGGNSASRGIKHILIFIRAGIRFFNLHGWKFI